MNPPLPWNTSCRIVDLDPRDGQLAASLRASGHEQLLCVARDQAARDRIVAQHSQLASHITVAPAERLVRLNNADLLILGAGAWRSLLPFRPVRHAQQVALRCDSTISLALGLAAGLGQCLLGRLRLPRIVAVGRHKAERLVLFEVRKRRPYTGVRRFVPHSLGVEGFLARLKSHSVGHAVLRWFDDLPEVAPGEDLDLLVDDKQLDTVRSWLDEGVGTQAVDLYSVSGLPGSDYRNLPYYPPYLAEQLLSRAQPHRDLCLVPAPLDHFHSLAYHALYHKGYSSGLPQRGVKPARKKNPEHNYPAILRRLADHLGIDVPVTLEDLDEYLDQAGWRPPHDMLVRLARKNKWVRTLLVHTSSSQYDDRVAVFLLRQEARHRGGLAKANALVEGHGFRVVASQEFTPQQQTSVPRSIRGGNWGQGPWALSGGEPYAMIVAFDPQPIAPDRKQQKRYPFLANARLLCKEKIRNEFNRGFAESQLCNVIHSSDNGREAFDYLQIISPHSASELFKQALGEATVLSSQRRAA